MGPSYAESPRALDFPGTVLIGPESGTPAINNNFKEPRKMFKNLCPVSDPLKKSAHASVIWSELV